MSAAISTGGRLYRTAGLSDRMITHMDLDTFFVSVERLHNSAYDGKPLLIGGSGDRGVVASCSYEARAYGVSSAMPMKLARQLCPDAIVVRGDMDMYSRYSHLVTDIIREYVPVYEKRSIDEFYIDLTGMERFFGSYLLSCDLKQRIERETGLPISFGLSSNKTVSKIATGEGKPRGAMQVGKGNEKPFLAPLSVKKIPGVGEKTYQTLRHLGVRYIRTLHEMPVELMERALGQNGLDIWKKANAVDFSPVVPYTEEKSISAETTFQQDTTDVRFLKSQLVNLCEKLALRLRKHRKICACVTVKIRYSNFETFSRQVHIPYTNADHILIARVHELFDKLYQRRMLIRLVGIRFSKLVHGCCQIDLFDDSPKMISLYEAMDYINLRYGRKVQRAVGLDEGRS